MSNPGHWFKTAPFSKRSCLICKYKSNNGLVRVKNETIANAFIYSKIIIKPQSVCCREHLNENGIVKSEEYENIHSILKYYSAEEIKCLKALSLSYHFKNSNQKIFDKFRDINIISEEECKAITGWSKVQLIQFSKYITSINENSGRSLIQLIAIYRYWLRKGVSLDTLALLKNNSNKQQMSKYLRDIRNAIYKDFVPFFLGANREKDFFLQHNNDSVRELHKLKENDLAIFADATYCRLEKSSNNQFQYLCWSQQKMDHLLKPFIICCADGYIIDCYGPFQANQNDASIFDYVLQTDDDLKRLLVPNETIAFLDRGKCCINLSE